MNSERARIVRALTFALIVFAALCALAALLVGCSASDDDECDDYGLVAAPAATKTRPKTKTPSPPKPRVIPAPYYKAPTPKPKSTSTTKPKHHGHDFDLCDD